MASAANLRPSDSQQAIETARRLHREAVETRAAGQPAEAAPLALRAIEILEREEGARQIDVVTVLNALAHIQEDLGHLAAAEVSVQRALGILERLRDLGEDRILIRLQAQSLGLLANLKRDQGHHAEAEEIFCRALALTEEAFGASHSGLGDPWTGHRRIA
jgi:tetratricopeptide (TPR) repeat protein